MEKKLELKNLLQFFLIGEIFQNNIRISFGGIKFNSDGTYTGSTGYFTVEKNSNFIITNVYKTLNYFYIECFLIKENMLTYFSFASDSEIAQNLKYFFKKIS